jgi:hypothetical protein
MTNNTLLWNYFIGWVHGAFAPFLLIFGLVYKRYLLVVCGAFCLVLIYLLTAYKTAIFMIVFLPVLMLFFYRKRNFLALLFVFITSIAILASILSFCFDSTFLLNFFIRRVLLDSGIEQAWYWKFFSQNQLAYLSESVFKWFIRYPYEHSIPYEVQYFITGAYGDADANVFASAYANFGLLGMPLVSILLAIFLWFYDSVTKNIDRKISLTAVVWLAFLFSNSDFLVVLNTHGALLWLILLYLISPIAKKCYENCHQPC